MILNKLAAQFVAASLVSAALSASAQAYPVPYQDKAPSASLKTKMDIVSDFLLMSLMHRKLAESGEITEKSCKVATDPNLEPLFKEMEEDFKKNAPSVVKIPVQRSPDDVAQNSVDVPSAIATMRQNYRVVIPVCYQTYGS